VGLRDAITGREGRPSPATLISLLALFVALAGTAYALERGSVKSKHIAADAVRAKHVQDNAVGGSAVDEASLDAVPDALALDGLDLAEVTGDGKQSATTTGTVALTDCNLISDVNQSITLTRPARILVFASGMFDNSAASAVDAIVELRQSTTTVANSPSTRTLLNSDGEGRYAVTALLRTGGGSEEIAAGTYTLRVELDSVPCAGGSASFGSESLGHLVVGAR
jgi:hypothetical protein